MVILNPNPITLRHTHAQSRSCTTSRHMEITVPEKAKRGQNNQKYLKISTGGHWTKRDKKGRMWPKKWPDVAKISSHAQSRPVTAKPRPVAPSHTQSQHLIQNKKAKKGCGGILQPKHPAQPRTPPGGHLLKRHPLGLPLADVARVPPGEIVVRLAVRRPVQRRGVPQQHRLRAAGLGRLGFGLGLPYGEGLPAADELHAGVGDRGAGGRLGLRLTETNGGSAVSRGRRWHPRFLKIQLAPGLGEKILGVNSWIQNRHPGGASPGVGWNTPPPAPFHPRVTNLWIPLPITFTNITHLPTHSEKFPPELNKAPR